MVLSLIPETVWAAPAAVSGTVEAHEGCEANTAVPWNAASTVEAKAVTVSNFGELAAAVKDGKAADIVLTTTGGTDEWEWTETLTIDRTVHITVAAGKTITLKRSSGAGKEVPLFTAGDSGKKPALILGDGQLTWTWDGRRDLETGETPEEAAYKAGSYQLTKSGGALIIDGGAVWSDSGAATAYFINEKGERVSKHNNGIDTTAPLIRWATGTLDIWGGVTLEKNVKTTRSNVSTNYDYGHGAGSAIDMGIGKFDSATAPTLGLYGGLVQWCAATGAGENGTGAIYAGNYGNDWLAHSSDDQYGAVKMFGGGVAHNATYSAMGNKLHQGDGAGIALDTATLDLYGGSVSYNCGDHVCRDKGEAADGGGIGGRVAAQVNLYGGEVSYNWTGGFGGGVCLWNSQGLLAGTSITNNTAGFGGGVAIAGCDKGGDDGIWKDSAVAFSQLTMTGGRISYNEATGADGRTYGGVGGGICAGTETRPNGSILDLKGGEVSYNKAQDGGGVAAYAGRVTALKMSGDAVISGNTAYGNGGGAYFTNHATGYKGDANDPNRLHADYIHPLLEMSHLAQIDTGNPVYFENVLTVDVNGVTTVQTPVKVTGWLEREGNAAVLEFAEGFWDPEKDKDTYHAHAEKGLKIVDFVGENGEKLDVQENKFSLDSSVWYLSANTTGSDTSSGCLELQAYTDRPQYSIRNGTPVEIKTTTKAGTAKTEYYYRIYDSLADAFTEAADGDTLYIFYNTNVKTPAVVDGKHITLLAESSSSAGVAASLSGGTCAFDQTHMDEHGYYVMSGRFLKYSKNNVIAGDKYTVKSENNKVTASSDTDGKYYLDQTTEHQYNVRNDYTVTLDSTLKLNDTSQDAPKDTSAAIVVKGAKGHLELGQQTTVGIGYGSLTFDGYAYYSVDGPMLKVDENSAATIHSGVTLKKHTNYSEDRPGTVYTAGTLTLEDGAAILDSVSPKAGAVYVASGGTFHMNGGTLSGNTGAMPRWGQAAKDGQPATGTGDDLYHGQAKYYYGAGAVNVASGGTFRMTGGTISGNRGEWGAVAGLGGTMELTGGTVSGNAALIGNGSETGIGAYDLTKSGYTEGTNAAYPDKSPDAEAGSGGGLYLGGTGGTTTLGGVTISGNWAQKNGGGIAECGGKVSFSGGGSTAITSNTAAELGGGIFAGSGVDVTASVVLSRNTAKAGGGLAALGNSADQKAEVTISSNVSSNTADYGGGVYVGAWSQVTVKNAGIEDNTAIYGGGAYVDCAKTVGGTVIPDVKDPGDLVKAEGQKDVTDEEFTNELGADVAGSEGALILGDRARINNNHLTTSDDKTVGFGSGVYDRGQLTLDKGSYVGTNDHLYLEKDRVVTLGEGYEAAGQTTEDKLTFNSRQTALGTNLIQMNDEGQFAKLLTAGSERAAHYGNIPMALATRGDETNIIELNYHTITYYDKAPDTAGARFLSAMVVPGNPYTILGWDGVNALTNDTDKKLERPAGKSLSGWKVATQSADGAWTVGDQVAYTAGTSYTAIGDLTLVADFTTNNYLAVRINNVEGQEKVTENRPELGDVRLSNQNLNSDEEGVMCYFSNGMDITLDERPVLDANGHRKGVLSSVALYEYLRPMTSLDVAQEQAGDTITYGVNVYKKRAVAEFKTVDLTVDGETTTYTTGTPSGWVPVEGTDPLNDQFKCENGVLSYVGGEKHFLVVATFKEPKVELKMEPKDGGTPVLEYYDTMRQAFTRMANVIAASGSGAWGTSTITPLKADEETGGQPGTDGLVYYYGKGYAGTYADNTFGAARDVDVVFDLNGFTMDFQQAPQQSMEQYDLTVKNGAIVSRVTEAQSGETDPSLFVVRNGGKLTLEKARLVDDNAAYNVIVGQGGSMVVDQHSQAGKVLLADESAYITAKDPTQWTERTAGSGLTATIYTDLGSLATPATRDADGQVTEDGETDTTRQVIAMAGEGKSSFGHAVRSHFGLKDSNLDDTTGDDGPNWFINTGGVLFPRVTDVIPQLVCQNHSQQEESDQVRTETPSKPGDSTYPDKQAGEGDTWYPIYYYYERAYGYNNRPDAHPLSIVTTLRDAYGNRVETAAGGVVTVTMVRVEEGEKNRVLTARVQVDGEMYDAKRLAGTATYLGTDANPTFPAAEDPYYLTSSFTGIGEYAAAYRDYWKVRDSERADDNMTFVSGLSMLTIGKKDLSDPSVTIASVTPGSASYIGKAGADNNNTSRAGTVRVRDNNTNLNLTSGDDLQNYYRRLTTVDTGGLKEAGKIGGTTYWYADDMYYTATGTWYGKDGSVLDGKVAKIDGQDVGLYSVEVTAIESSSVDEKLRSVNYTGASGWRGKIFEITPYSGRLNPTMTNNIVADVDSVEEVKSEIQETIESLKITDIYGNVVPKEKVTYQIVPADSNAKVDANGWPCAEGLYSIEIHPYDSGAVNEVTSTLVGMPTSDPNYSSTATGYQALLITREALSMEIKVQNAEDTDWQAGRSLKVPYTGTIYWDSSVKAYDRGDHGDRLQVVKKGDSTNQRLDKTEYSLQVGLPDDPALNAGGHVLVATDGSGKYVAIGRVEIQQNALGDPVVDPEEAVYTGRRIIPTISVKGSQGLDLVEGRDYTVTITRQDNPGVITGTILNAGKYIITIAGKGNYGGETKTATFEVLKKDISPEATDGVAKVEIAVPTYNLGDGQTRPKAVVTYNGMVLSPGTDYEQMFEPDTNTPEKITFNGRGNYTGSYTVKVETAQLPDNTELTIVDTNNSYIYQATGLMDYLVFEELKITKATREDADREIAGFEDYEVAIATVSDYMDRGVDGADFKDPEDFGDLNVGSYIVRMTEKTPEERAGYFFVRIVPRSVTIKVRDWSKVYGEAKPAYPYTTNLQTLVGSGRATNSHGVINPETGFYDRDTDKITGNLYRAEGEDVGSYYYALNDFSAGSNYTLSVSSDTMFTITPKSLSDGDGGIADKIAVDYKTEVEYTGYPVSPLDKVTYDADAEAMSIKEPMTLYENADYTLTYYRKTGEDSWMALSAAPIDVGEYKLTITGIGNYTDAVSVEFSVVASGNDLKVALTDSQIVYRAKAYHPEVTVRTSGNSVLNSSSYGMTYSYADPTGTPDPAQQNHPFDATTTFTDAGTYTLYVNGKGNYAGAYGTATFTILPKDLAESDDAEGTKPVAVQKLEDRGYTGQPLDYPEGLGENTVTYGGVDLAASVGLVYKTDYELTYMDNTNAGTATAVLVGRGNYTGTRAVKFQITPKDVYVEVGNATKIYGTGDPDYTYKVYEKDAENDTYTELSGIKLTGRPGRDTAEENVGSYDLDVGTLSAGGNYNVQLRQVEQADGSFKAPQLTITPKPIGDNGNVAERIVASIDYVEATEGAQWPTPTVTYWKATTSDELIQDTDYTVAYYKVGEDGTDTPVNTDTAPTESDIGSYYAMVTAKDNSNYVKQFRLDFMVVKPGSYLAVDANPKQGTYDPAGETIRLTARKGKDDVTDAAEFTVVCYSTSGSQKVELNADKKSFQATAAGTYVIKATYVTPGAGSADEMAYGSTTVVIDPKQITEVQVEDIPEQDYTGDALTPKLTITDGTKTLELVVDYTVSYSKNVAPDSTGEAVITGMGNYTGTRTVEFQIGPMQYTLSYDANGGDGNKVPAAQHSQEEFYVASGAEMTHAPAAPDSGTDTVPVLFVGWSTAGGDKIYKKGETLPNTMVYAGQTLQPDKPATTLYAVWGYDADNNGKPDVSQGTIKVVYCTGGGTTGRPPEDNTKYLLGDRSTAEGPGSLEYKEDGKQYVFMGWTATDPGDGSAHGAKALADYLKLTVTAQGQTFYVSNSGNGNFNLYPVWGIDEDKNGTADFLEGDVALIYDANGGTGGPDTQNAKAGQTVKLNDQKPTRANAVFLGWTRDRVSELLETEPTETGYQPGDEFQVPEKAGTHITLYALWAKDRNGNGTEDYKDTKYKVVYELNGADAGVTAPTDSNTYLELETVILHSGSGLTKQGSLFDGWSLKADGDPLGSTYQIPKGAAGDTLTFYARWVENKHTVTVKVIGSGGSAYVGDTEGMATATVQDGESAKITFVPASGYGLGSVLVNGTEETVTGGTLALTNITEDKTVIVTFSAKDFTVDSIGTDTYDGTAKTPEVTVKDNGTTLTAGTDYTVVYTPVEGTGAKLDNGKPVNAGTYTVTVTGVGSYDGKSASAAYVIKPKDLLGATVTVTENADGTSLTVTVTDGGKTLTAGTDYTVSYSGNVTPGQKVTVTVTGLGNYTGKVEEEHTVTNASQRTLIYKNGETVVATEQYAKGATVTVRGADGLTAEEGYVFGGWRSNDHTIYKPGDTFLIHGHTTLTAVWTAKTKVKATYHLDDGTMEASAEVDVGGSITLRDGPEQTGYTFLGWTLDAAKTIDTAEETVQLGRLYPGGEQLVLTEDVDLYPVWIKTELLSTYRLVLYRANGGDDSEIEDTAFLEATEKHRVISGVPTRTEHVFLGWTTEAEAPVTTLEEYEALEDSILQANDELEIQSSTDTLYALWAVDRNGNGIPDYNEDGYTVEYDLNDGSGTAEDSSTYLVGQTVTLNDGKTLTKQGYLFAGWRLTEGGTLLDGTYTVAAADDTDGDKVITFYAVWTENRHTVKVNAGSGGTAYIGATAGTVTDTVLDGGDAIITIEAEDGYSLGKVWVNGEDKTADVSNGTLALTNITEDQVVTVTFQSNSFAVDSIDSVTYNGSAQEPKVTVKDNGVELTAGTDYTVTYTDNTDAGTAAVTVTGLGKYAGQEAATFFIIQPKELTEDMIEEIGDQSYTGNALTPELKIADGGKELVLGKDYTVSYSDNVQPGTATAAVTGLGNYTGKVEVEFTIGDGRFQVTYDPDGAQGDVPKDGRTYLANERVTVLGQGSLTKAGCIFGGWTDGTKTYQPGDTFTITASVTLTAVWKPEVLYTVSYDLNGGNGTVPETKSYLPGAAVTVASGAGLSKAGAKFAGWSTTQYLDILDDLSIVDKLYGGGSTFVMGTENVPLFAVWATPEALSVYYSLEFVEGVVIPRDTQSEIAQMPSKMFFQASSTVNIKAIQPYDVRDGYKFLGWSEDRDGTKPIDGPNITIGSDTVLYALFTKDSRNVYTHAGTGGSITPAGPEEVDYGGSFTFQVKVKSGYRLDKVTVNGRTVALDDSDRYTVEDIDEDIYVMATFTSTSTSGGGGGHDPKPDPDSKPDPDPKPITPDDTGVSSVLNTREHNAFMTGYDTGEFGPNNNVTRAEVAQMFYNLLLEKDVPITVQFTDVPEDAWYAKAVNTLASLGIIQGVGDGRYAPKRAITRAEFAVIATRFANSTVSAKASFVDVPETHWAYRYINVAASYGWVDGYGGNRFGPDDLFTRAQAATIVNRMLGRLGDRDAVDEGRGRDFPDVTKSHWAWYQIVEATTDHGFTIDKNYTSETWHK